MKKKEAIKIAAAVLAHPTLKGAAESLGISNATLWRDLKNKEVRECLDKAQKNLLRECTDSIRAGMLESVIVVRKILIDPKTSTGFQLAAARTILDVGFRLITITDLETRMATLEAAHKVEED